jgi:hypothetical protein
LKRGQNERYKYKYDLTFKFRDPLIEKYLQKKENGIIKKDIKQELQLGLTKYQNRSKKQITWD